MTKNENHITTIVIADLLKCQGDSLLSRAQGKRLIGYINGFKEVTLDFNGIDTIGQSFADQVFRVFKKANPDIQIHVININSAIDRMIKHVEANL